MINKYCTLECIELIKLTINLNEHKIYTRQHNSRITLSIDNICKCGGKFKLSSIIYNRIVFL